MTKRRADAPIPTNWAQVAALRMERQHLAQRVPRDRMIDVAHEMVGFKLRSRAPPSSSLSPVSMACGRTMFAMPSPFEPWVNELPRRVHWMLPTDRHDAVHRTAGWVSAVVMLDGRVGGTWELVGGAGRRGTVEVKPFAPRRGDVRNGLEVEVDRVAAYLDRPLDVTVLTA